MRDRASCGKVGVLPHHPSVTVSDPSASPSPTEAGALRIEAIGLDRLDVIRRMNREVFQEERIINRFDRPDLLMLIATLDDRPVGFKVGYGEGHRVFYSAKGGVLKPYRRQGLAIRLLEDMMDRVREMDYARFAYDTFPNRHPGMLILGLNRGFKITAADFNPVYRDFRLRLEKDL